MNPQKVSFKSIEDLLAFLPKNELKVVEFLRELVHNCIPNCTEKLSYNVPYFSLHKRICFIWPSAVPWGKVKKDGVLFGFCQGHLLNDDINYLDKGSRKQVYTKTFMSIQDVNVDMLRAYLFEALEIDSQL